MKKLSRSKRRILALGVVLGTGLILGTSSYMISYIEKAYTKVEAKEVVHEQSREPIIYKDTSLISYDEILREVEAEEEKELENVTAYIEVPVEIVEDKLVKVGNTEINLTKIEELSNEDVKLPNWDKKLNKYKTTRLVAKYLNEAAGFTKELSAGIAGNVAYEGNFGYAQGTYKPVTSYWEAISKLDNGLGFGICQWTYHTVKKELKSYYVEAKEKLEDSDLDTISKVAELAYLIDTVNSREYPEIVKGYVGNLQTVVYSNAGLFAVDYERYRGSRSQWNKTKSGVYLTGLNTNGSMRAKYAWNLYKDIFK